jgi:threonine synthase
MMGFQAEGAAPIVRGYPDLKKPETVATAIAHRNAGRPGPRLPAARDEFQADLSI